MRQLFPAKQVGGYVFSLVLTLLALSVYYFHMSKTLAMTIFLLTAFIQAAVQIVLFMHAREIEDSKSVFATLYYAIFIVLITVFGTLVCMVWGMA
ncbi:cytochrome aa3 quinol oxidase subunit IV [Peribacillus kribbensis]|uniref:cytochrome aa3 quinol oxidase subunit IV n=1 Tax=Peribacillus kribbensis TaxID=356658 RepID=UPI0004791A69|nr:cytochrome aa3 quinol oxidase subunit IV [Peribacillus kribbensis]